MITESLLIFLTTMMSLNQPTNSGQQISPTKQDQTKTVVASKHEPASSLLRGGWDRN